MHKNLRISISVIIIVCLGTLVNYTHDLSEPTAYKLTKASEGFNSYLPMVLAREIDSPFWIQIAAIHQIPAESSRAEQMASKAEWKAMIAEA